MWNTIESASMPARRHQIKPDHPIQIPRATKSRDSRIIDACILYIYGDSKDGERVTKYKDLAIITGAGAKTIQDAKIADKWEDFRLDLIAEQLKQRDGTELSFARKRSSREVKMIADEKERQILEIPKLEEQAQAIVEAMKEFPPGSKLYPGLVTSLDRVTKMLDERSGKASEEKEIEDMQKALIKLAAAGAKKAPEKTQKGENVTLVIEGDLP